MLKKISVIIPIFNSEKYLQRSLKSIFKQSFKVHEVIIIDDGSCDNSKKIVFNWMNKLPISYYKNDRNMGVPFSLRKGICLSKGDIIFRLDSDDEWRKNHVKNIYTLINKNKNSVLFASRASYKYPSKKEILISKILSSKTIKKDLMWDNPIVHSTVAFRKEDYLKTCGYMNYKIAHDYGLFIELLRLGELSFSKNVSVNYYVNNNSLSKKNNKESLKERLLNQWRAIYLFKSESKLLALKIIPILLIRTIFKK